MLGALALISSWLAVIAAARGVLRLRGQVRWSIALCLATLVMGAVPALIGRLTHDLVVAVLITAALAIAVRLRLRRRLARLVPPVPPLLLPAPWAIAVGLAGAALVAWTAIIGHYWDENAAHFAVSNTIARGLLPPEHPLFPGEPFRYHYMFNVLAGQVRAFTGVGVARAIDVVTIGAYLLLVWVAATAGAAMGNRRGASLAMVLVPLGTGALQFVLFRDFGPLELHWDALPSRWLQSIPPPVVSNVFQHPMGLAMPLSLGVLLLWSDSEDDLGRDAVAAVALGMLGLAHIVFFGLLGLSLGVMVVVRTIATRRWGRGALRALLLLGALGIAYSLGGFFAPGGRVGSMLTFERDFFSEPFGWRIAHLLVLFGLPLLAVPVALARVRAKPMLLRIALLTATIIGYAIPNLMTYGRSWDIVKFLGVAAFVSNLLLADVIAAAWRNRTCIGGVAVAAAVVLATCTSWIWLVRTSVLDGKAGIPAMHFQAPPAIAEAVADRLGPLVAPHERVFTTNVDLSKGSGFLTPGFDWRRFGTGYVMDRDRCDRLRMHHVAARRHLKLANLEALDVRWAVLSPGDVRGLSAEGRAALDDGRRFQWLFDVESSGDKRHVYRVIR